jgi:hypothetical protein
MGADAVKSSSGERFEVDVEVVVVLEDDVEARRGRRW